MTLVLFDFDGTLTKRDTLLPFIHHTCGSLRFYTGMLLMLPFLGAYAAGIISAHDAKTRVLRFFFKRRSKAEIESAGETFCKEKLPALLRPDGMALLKAHLAEGNEVAVVSASCEPWVKPFCVQEGIGCICTGMEFDREEKFTGRLCTPNCKGEEKPRRIREVYELARYSRIIAYGDSPADLPMLGLAHEKHMLKRYSH
jgi:phosphatidylglycerophosphatase C